MKTHLKVASILSKQLVKPSLIFFILGASKINYCKAHWRTFQVFFSWCNGIKLLLLAFTKDCWTPNKIISLFFPRPYNSGLFVPFSLSTPGSVHDFISQNLML